MGHETMSRCLYVSFYTPDYADCAKELEASLYLFGLDSEIDAFADLGTWQANCAWKPRFILQKLWDNPGRPVVWLDADAVIRRRPILLEEKPAEELDLRVCQYQWKRGKRETLSGTLYFGNHDSWSEELVKCWIRQQDQSPEMWDQVSLEYAIHNYDRACGHVDKSLPVEYCWIFDFHKAEHPGGVPVIEHFQRSRVTRAKGGR